MTAASWADNARRYNAGMARPAGSLGLEAGAPLRGELRPPGSKSIAQRALLAAALARGTTRLQGLPQGDDVRAALGLIAALGCVEGDARPPDVVVRGRAPADGGPRAQAALDVGESGTLARLATAALALTARPGTRFELRARGTLLRRSSPALFAALRSARVGVEGDGWPTRLASVAAPEVLTLGEPGSSQEVSALLLALAAHPGTRRLEVAGEIPSRPYVDLTLRVLQGFGALFEERARGPVRSFVVEGPLVAPDGPLDVEPDASLAAVALAAGCLSDGEVRVSGLGPASVQGDVRIVEHLRAFGCDAGVDADGLHARGLPTRGARLDLRGEPDLAPVLAVVAAAAAARAPRGAAPSELTGLETLPGKESSRIDVLAEGLRSCGWSVRAGSDRLRVDAPAPCPGGPHRLDPRGDHRMAFAFALLGLLRPGVRVARPGCVAKSWPRFWDDLGDLGADVRQD
jgi:3-phosphoshikimate 1-carboxyvinyltransferase